MKKSFIGIVKSTGMQKTAVVEVTKKTPHPMYKKLLKKSKKYKVDTGELILTQGDSVRIVETHPISKEKYFKIEKILESAKEKK